MTRVVLWIAALTSVFMLTLASGYALDVVIGAIVAAGALLLLRRLIWPPGSDGSSLTAGVIARRALAAPAFFAVTVWEITIGTWAVAMIVLGLRPLGEPGVVVIPVDDRTEAGAIVTALAATLSPGELLVHHDAERRELHMHVIDASDPDAVRERYRTNYLRWQRKFIP